MSKSFKGAKAAAFSAAAIAVASLSFASPVEAQQNLRSSGWFKACSDQGESKICNVQYQGLASTGQVITSVNLAEISGATKRRVFQITVPTNRLIPPGIKLQIDEKKPSSIPYAFCMPRMCAAEIPLDDKLVAVLKAGSKLTITSTNDQRKENPIAVTLEGFGAAYDGEPIKREALDERQKKLEEELQAEAKKVRDKLLEAQNKAREQSQASE